VTHKRSGTTSLPGRLVATRIPSAGNKRCRRRNDARIKEEISDDRDNGRSR